MPVKSSGPGVLGKPFGLGPFQAPPPQQSTVPPPTDVPIGPAAFYDLRDLVTESWQEPFPDYCFYEGVVADLHWNPGTFRATVDTNVGFFFLNGWIVHLAGMPAGWDPTGANRTAFDVVVTGQTLNSFIYEGVTSAPSAYPGGATYCVTSIIENDSERIINPFDFFEIEDEVTDSYQELLPQDDPEVSYITVLEAEQEIEDIVTESYQEPLAQDNPEVSFIGQAFDLFEIEDEVTESYQEAFPQDDPEVSNIIVLEAEQEIEDIVTDSYQEPFPQDDPDIAFIPSQLDLFEIEDEVTDSLQEPALIDAAVASDTEQIVYLDSDAGIEEFVDDASLAELGLIDAAPIFDNEQIVYLDSDPGIEEFIDDANYFESGLIAAAPPVADVALGPLFSFYDLPTPILGTRFVIPTGAPFPGPFDNEQIVYLDSDPGIEEWSDDDANYVEPLPFADIVAAVVLDSPVGPVDFYDLRDAVTESYQEPQLIDAAIIVIDVEQIVYLDSDPGIEEFVDDANYFETFPQDDPDVSAITNLEAEQEIVEERGVGLVSPSGAAFEPLPSPDNEQTIVIEAEQEIVEEPGLDLFDNETAIFAPPPPPPDNEQTIVIEAEQEIEDLPGLDFLDNETAIFAFPVAPPAAVIAARGGRDVRREVYEEQEFVLHWLLMDH